MLGARLPALREVRRRWSPCPVDFSMTAGGERFARLDDGAAPNARHSRLPQDGPSHPTSSAAGSCRPHPEREARSAPRERNTPTRATPAVRWFQISPLIRPFHESRQMYFSSAIRRPQSLSTLSKSERTTPGTPRALHARRREDHDLLLATLAKSPTGYVPRQLAGPAGCQSN